MGKSRRRLIIVAILGVLAIAAIYVFRGMPEVAAAAMRNADSFELLSLDPDRRPEDADFHGFRALGRAAITDPAMQKRLYRALQSGARWNVPIAAACFSPRHGIRVNSQGRTIDLVICFECSQVQVWQGETETETFLVGTSPQRVFDQALRDAGLPLGDE